MNTFKVQAVSEELLGATFAVCPNANEPQLPGSPAVLIFYHEISIGISRATSDTTSVFVDLDAGEDGTVRVLAPRDAVRSLNELGKYAKKVKINSRAKQTRTPLAVIAGLDVNDAVLCSYMHRHRIPLAVIRGPLLSRKSDGTVSLCLGLSLVADAAVTSVQQQHTALKFLARALHDETLVNPLDYVASPTELLRVITHEPSRNPPVIEPKGMQTQLLPYQRDSVSWCIRKEGKTLASPSSVEDLDPSIRDTVVGPPLGWREVPGTDIDAPTVWVSPYVLRTTSIEPRQHYINKEDYHGKGLLAEEMGLGKTLEITAVILLNPRPNKDLEIPHSEPTITKSRATLVIAPKTILQQWVDEVRMHAPKLKTVVVSDKVETEREFVDADMVFISYSQLSRWLPGALFKDKRRTRYNHHGNHAQKIAKFGEIDRSSLARIEFWRVVLDEVQLVHTGASTAAHAARNIPRIHAWAVSGTPVKQSLEDLRGIIYFLDLYPFVERPAWQRLISSPIDFSRTMSVVGMRHTKPMVAHQLYIPPQHRKLIMLKLSAVERARYDRIYRDFRNDAQNSSCNLSQWLVKLRQAYFITVGNQHNNDPGSNSFVGSFTSSGSTSNEVVALTLDQVLTQLIDEADAEVWTVTRDAIVTALELGQLYDKADQLPKALEGWHQLAEEIQGHITVAKANIAELGVLAKEQQAAVKVHEDALKAKKRLKIEEISETDSQDVHDDHDVEDEENEVEFDELTEAQDLYEHALLLDAKRAASLTSSRTKSIKKRLKSLQELLHRTYFFIGTGYFRCSQRMRLKLEEEDLSRPENQEILEKNSTAEAKYYEYAEQLRNDSLSDAEERVEHLITKVPRLSFTKMDPILDIPKSELVDKLSAFAVEIGDILRGILSEPLMEKQVEQATPGVQVEDDYYAKTLDLQEHAFVYLEILQLILRDRAAAINGGSVQPKPMFGDGGDKELWQQLVDRREEIVGLLQYDRSPLHPLIKGMGEEYVAKKVVAEVRTTQRLYSILRDLYNARVEYYKQLQDLSDQVTDLDLGETKNVEQRVRNKQLTLEIARQNIQNHLKNQIYLRNLGGSSHTQRQEKSDDAPVGAKFTCVICLDEIKTGALTPCGHSFCADCLGGWLASHNSCPLCKRRMTVHEVHTFLTSDSKAKSDEVKDEETTLPISLDSEPNTSGGSSDTTDDTYASDLFHPISNKLYNRIHRIELVRLYGIKVDMMVRLVKYLRAEDPSAQIIVFSQWLSMLKVLYTAFTENAIVAASSTKLSNNMKADVNSFRENRRVACLLLHAKADVAGLTLVNANHVFLWEPLLNTALELQAVSRINRIGQSRDTYVWQFCVENTVEQTILGSTTKERIFQSAAIGDMETADSSTLAEATTKTLIDRKSGAEIVGKNILQQILFKQPAISTE